jgi:hypothetical protein
MGKILLRLRNVLNGRFASPKAVRPGKGGKVKSFYVEEVKKGGKKAA